MQKRHGVIVRASFSIQITAVWLFELVDVHGYLVWFPFLFLVAAFRSWDLAAL
jgi:hypothetical protein